MPDQDSHRRAPDSDHRTGKDRDSTPDDRNNHPTIGSEPPTAPRAAASSVRSGDSTSSHTNPTPLKEILGDYTANRLHDTESKAGESQAGDDRVLEAREEAARRIAQSLHDDASQMLALAHLELADIARDSSETTRERINRVIGHLDSVCEQLRGLSHELHPMFLERHGLMPALNSLAEGVSTRSGLEVKIIGEASHLPARVELGIYRVVQEALANVVRHAGASKAEIRLWETKDRLHCSISDNGVGFQSPGPEPGARYVSGLGLVGIYERIDSLGGECYILSGDRQGMELTMGIPI